jgi:MYXO-CTERM domain-containing protein
MRTLRRRCLSQGARGPAGYPAVASFGGALAAAAVVLAVPQRAEANGRYPEAGQLVVGVTNADRIVVRATYGFVVSSNGGADWRWVCEQAIGFSDVFDPPVALLEGDAIIAGLTTGLSRSSDFGCSFARESNVFPDKYVIDVTADRSAPQNGWAVTTTPVGGVPETRVFSTTDAGATWSPSGPPVAADFLAVTIEVAQSNPSRVYVSGVVGDTYEPVVAVSDDAGQSWTLNDNLGFDGTAYISAVDPNDEDRLYARVRGNNVDTLYVSTDGAGSFQPVVERPGLMLGFALSTDGSRIAIGGPSFGIESADAFDLQFSKRSDISARCLTFHGSNLFVCGDEAADGFTVGTSTDEGATVTPLFTVAELGQMECEPAASTCAEYWAGLQSLLGLDPSVAAATSTSSGGGGGETDDGCGCETGGPRTRTPWLVGCLVLLGARLVSRRRSSRPSSA